MNWPNIVFNCDRYLDVFPDYQAFRAMDLAMRLGYQMHSKVQEFVRLRLRQTSVDEFLVAIQKHRREITRTQIEEFYRQYQ